MKKSVKVLKLNRETLRALNVAGGTGATGTHFCGNTETCTCVSWCNFCLTDENTCTCA